MISGAKAIAVGLIGVHRRSSAFIGGYIGLVFFEMRS